MLITIIEEHCFDDDLKQISGTYPRVYDVKDAIIWTLARTPRVGTPLPGHPDFRTYETTGIGATPAFWVLYKVVTTTSERVHLVAITPVPDADADSDF